MGNPDTQEGVNTHYTYTDGSKTDEGVSADLIISQGRASTH